MYNKKDNRKKKKEKWQKYQNIAISRKTPLYRILYTSQTHKVLKLIKLKLRQS